MSYATPQGRVDPAKDGMDLYPAYESKDPSASNWSMFGYPEAMINMATARDDEKAIKWIHEAGWIDRDTRTLDGKTMCQFLEKKGARKCAKALKALGYA